MIAAMFSPSHALLIASSLALVAGAATRPATRPAVSIDALKQSVAGEADVVAKASAAAGDPANVRAAEKELDAARQAAWDNLRGLRGGPLDDTVKAAKQHHDRLNALVARLNVTYAHHLRAAEALAHRQERVEALRRLNRAAAAAAEADTARLAALAEAAIGFPPAVVAEYQASRDLVSPEEEDRHGLWLYVVSRRIESYNRTEVEPLMERGEVAHARRLNAYRELLGLLPLELDARLVQSARRHSREMIELAYFSHTSPTEGLGSFFDRMAAAGYDRPANENIQLGRWDGDESFWKLFYSPGHHKAMVAPRYTALGVGRWDAAWTENFGAGQRLMLATREERAAARVQGQVLGPQRVDPSKKRGPLDLSNLRIYDPLGPKRAAKGPTSQPAGEDAGRQRRRRGEFPLDR
jgi:uncharacterized protein YkwD